MKCILRMKKLVVMVVTMQKLMMEMVTMVSVLLVAVIVVTTMVMVEAMVVTIQEEDNHHQFATVLVLMQRQIWSTSHPIHINNIITILLDQEQGFSITWKATFPALLPLLLSNRSNKRCLELAHSTLHFLGMNFSSPQSERFCHLPVTRCESYTWYAPLFAQQTDGERVYGATSEQRPLMGEMKRIGISKENKWKTSR